MLKPTGSWVAIPTPFTEDNQVDYAGFETLIKRQIQCGTSELFVLGSAGETTLLTTEEKRRIVKEVVAMTKGKIPVFFNASAPTTEGSMEFARYCEEQDADGVIFTIPPYVLIPQVSALEHLSQCMGAVSIPCGIYNNPSRLGVNVDPETIATLAQRHTNFVVDKEAMPDVKQLVQIKRLCGDRLNLLCCDFPKYSIVIPTLAVGGHGTANIGGNIIPEEAALYSRPWTDMQIMEDCRREYFKWFPLLEMLYQLSNPIVIKAALKILGLPGGPLRRPYQEFSGPHLERLEKLMDEMGVIKKYGVKR